MGLFDLFKTSIKKEEPTDWLPDFDIEDNPAKRAYLKTMAKDTVLNFVARTMSTLEIKFKNKDDPSEWDYVLNVRPNKDMSAATFWEKMFYRLLDDNEVLIILTNDNQLLIADDYNRVKYAVYEDKFKDVIVKDYKFEKTFLMSEVIFLEYNNAELEGFTKGLFDDYSELFGRIVEIAMRNNQIRGSVSMELTGTLNDEPDGNGRTRTEKLQTFIDKVYASFRTNSVAIIPKTKAYEYEEYTNKQGESNQSLDELNKLKSSLIDDISNAIGVPTALIYGEKAELNSNIKAFKKLCTNSLAKKLKDELHAKVLSKAEYTNGERIAVVGVLPISIIENAVQIDKITSGGSFKIDEVREELEYDPLPDGEGDKVIRTKNYEELLEGGEEKDDEK